MEFEKNWEMFSIFFYFCIVSEFVCSWVGGDTFGYMWLYMDFLECMYEVFCKECIKSGSVLVLLLMLSITGIYPFNWM